jgi:phytoene dehydrogenase-like protein
MRNTDAVVIGSGPNGLVAANLLADAGWDVVLLETQPEVGGAVHSDSTVQPGYVHDTFSSFHPLAAASPVISGLELDKHGLEWMHAPAVVGTPFRNGDWVVLHQDKHETAAGLDQLCPGDGDAWLDMCRVWERIADQLLGGLFSPFPPVRNGIGLMARLPSAGGLSLVKMMLSPARSLADQHFRGTGPKLLITGNAGHADIPMDAPGSGLMGWLLSMLGQQIGFPVPMGGSGMLTRAMAARFESLGGEIRCGSRADEIVVRGGRAVGVHTVDGELIATRKAVLADVSAPALYGDLVSWDHLPAALARKMDRFEWDPGTVKVDWALDGPVPWRSAPTKMPGTVHISESVDEIGHFQNQLASGVVPDRPFMLLGQMAAADPSRAPAGGESMWAYTHVPQRVLSDAGGDGISGDWGSGDLEAMADRMQRRIEEYAPGFADRVVARRLLGPREMQARDENLVNGALNGGTSSLQQQLVFRPVPGLGRAETPVRNLYLASAAAHPGGAVHGACGSNAARAALAHDRVRRFVSLGRGTPPS